MPDPKDFKDEDSWMTACVPAVKEEGKDQDQAVAQCVNMWKERESKSAEPKIEYRSDKDGDIETRSVSEFRVVSEKGGKPKFEGYAAVFGHWSEDLGGFREIIDRGAFSDAIKNSDVRALFNHDRNYVLGRTTAGTLRLKEDKRGLFISNDPPDWANNLVESVGRGDIDQMSFGFTVADEAWNEDYTERTIKKINRLYDVSVVTEPAYPDTTVALRSMQKAKEEKEKPIFEHVESKVIEPELTRGKISELKEIAEKLNSFLAGLENTSDAEPKQGDEENKTEGDAGEPKQAEEARDVMKEIDGKLEKYQERFFA